MGLILLLFATTGGIARAGGAEVYNINCVICHRVDATGVPGMYPPLADSIGRYVAIPAGRAYLIHVVSFGMTGPIAVHGSSYDGVMQPWPQLEDQDVADVLNYILTTFSSKLLPKSFKPFTADEVRKNRAASSMGDVHKEREGLMKALDAHH